MTTCAWRVTTPAAEPAVTPFSRPDRGRPIRFRSHLPRSACGGHRHQHRWSSDRSLNSQSADSR